MFIGLHLGIAGFVQERGRHGVVNYIMVSYGYHNVKSLFTFKLQMALVGISYVIDFKSYVKSYRALLGSEYITIAKHKCFSRHSYM